MNFEETDEFSKELKRLAKKYKSLPDDLLEFKKIVNKIPLGSGKHFNPLTKTEEVIIIKARFFCRYLKGSSLRIVYAYHKDKEIITFIELYFKGEQVNEDKDRINQYLKDYKNNL